MPEKFQLTLIDPQGQTWVVPAELVDIPIKGHQFVVHKSLALSDDIWVVTHVATGASAAMAGTKLNAIHAARERLKGMSAKRFKEIIEKTQASVSDEAFAAIVRRYEDAGDMENADIIRKQWDAAKTARTAGRVL